MALLELLIFVLLAGLAIAAVVIISRRRGRTQRGFDVLSKQDDSATPQR